MVINTHTPSVTYTHTLCFQYNTLCLYYTTLLYFPTNTAAHSKMNVVHDGWAFQLQHDHPFMDKLFERNTIPPFTTTAVLLPADPLYVNE